MERQAVASETKAERITWIRKDLYDYRGYLLKRIGEWSWDVRDADGALIAVVADMGEAYAVVDAALGY